MKRTWTAFALAASLLLTAAPLPAAAADAAIVEGAKVTIDGKDVAIADPIRISDGRLFLPVAPLASLLGATVAWDGDNEAATLHMPNGDSIQMRNGVPVVTHNGRRYAMDTAPFLANGRTYLPFRVVAELTSSTVQWDEAERRATLTSGGAAEAAEARVAVASSLREAEPYTEEEFQLLAKLVQVEAGYESYEGQLAIANIILNRVKDSRFPDTIRDVIYSGRQFPPAHNGLLDKSEPNESALRATRDALDGRNNIEDAVYFYNPDVTGGAFWDRLEVVAVIGNHTYAKS
jgi:hypothetical protein